jgi:cytidylate kinase
MDEPEGHMSEERHITITISRQMGSGGAYIGHLAAKELGFKYLDREILRQAAEHFGTDVRMLEDIGERSPGLIETIIKGFSYVTPPGGTLQPMRAPVYSRDLFTMECKIIQKIADQYNAVIIGRGGFYALRERPGVIRVFIHAPREFRVKRVMQVQNITDIREARNKVKDSDHSRTKYIRDMAGGHWTDSRNFHLCIDSSFIGFIESAKMIVSLAKKIKLSDQGNGEE